MRHRTNQTRTQTTSDTHLVWVSTGIGVRTQMTPEDRDKFLDLLDREAAQLRAQRTPRRKR